jgi:hypothetical protein
VTTICGYPVHEVAEFYPMMSLDEFNGLVDDIAANGQLEPIVLDVDGALIDGRNRAKACEELAIAPTTKVHVGNVEQFVRSQNTHRRNLTTAQRAMVAAKFAKRAQGRSPVESKSSRDDFDLPPTRHELAAELNVSTPSIDRARQVVDMGIDDLQQMVTDGDLPLFPAVKAAKLAPERQQEFVDKVRAGAKPSAAMPAASPKLAKPQPPKLGGNRRKHLGILDAFAHQLSGSCIALDEIQNAGLDASVTKEEAARIRGDLSDSLKSVKRIIQLLQEFTS